MSELTRYYKSEVTDNKMSVDTKPQDAERIQAILQILSLAGGNKNPNIGGEPLVIQNGDIYQLISYPGTRSPLVYISYDTKNHKLYTCPKHILIRAIGNAIGKNISSEKMKEFEDIASKYKGADFLSQLFGLNGAKSLLTAAQMQFNGSNNIKQISGS